VLNVIYTTCEKDTGGVVTHFYVTNLREGRIESLGYEKIRAIGKAMGFPSEAWFSDESVAENGSFQAEGSDVAGRREHLFKAIRNPKMKEPYTNAGVARMNLRDLTESDVEGISSGKDADPSAGEVRRA
jgi:hypothetical protein